MTRRPGRLLMDCATAARAFQRWMESPQCGVAFSPVPWSLRECDGRFHSLRDAFAVGGRDVVRGAGDEAVDRVDGDVIVGPERLARESQDGIAEGGLQIERVAAEVEQDGEVDWVVPFAVHLGGVKARAGVEADVELVQADGRKWREGWAQDQCGYLHQIDVDVERVAGVVGGRGRGCGLGRKWGCGCGRQQQKRDSEMRRGRRNQQRSRAMRGGTSNSHAGIIAEVQRTERVESEESLES